VVDRVYGSILPSLWPLLDRGTASPSELGSGRPAEALNLVAGLMYLVGPMMLTATMGSRASTWSKASPCFPRRASVSEKPDSDRSGRT